MSDRRLRVATVLTARPWERALVEASRSSAAVRIVGRAFAPTDLPPGIDALVVGAETPWVSSALVRRWRSRGIAVVGVHPEGDTPGRRVFTRAGADEVLPESISAHELVGCLKLLRFVRTSPPSAGTVVGITGAGGAPGRTEVALGLAHAVGASAAVVDLDFDGPSLSLRLGVGPEPSILEMAEHVRGSGHIDRNLVRRIDGVDAVTGAFGATCLSSSQAADVVAAASCDYRWVVADLGPHAPRLGRIPMDVVVVVADASPTGIVRAAELFRQWTSTHHPLLVLNRVATDGAEMVAAARRATGLDPVALLPFDAAVRRRAIVSQAPGSDWVRRLQPVIAAAARTVS